MTDREICFLPAWELARRIRARELLAVEVMQAHLAQIERTNPEVNAIVTLLPEQAMDQAAAADKTLTRDQDPGPLHGLPIAHKDLIPTKGILFISVLEKRCSSAYTLLIQGIESSL